MPKELVVAVQHHHDLNYAGPYATYAHLSNLTQRLLKTHGMSNSDSDEIPDELLQKLALDEEEVFMIMDEVLQGGTTLNTMISAIA